MSETLETMGNAFDEALLGVLQNGRQVMDKDGNVETIEPSAADLNVIRQRLKDCGVTAMATSGSPIGNIVEEMRQRKLKLTALDDSEDAATA